MDAGIAARKLDQIGSAKFSGLRRLSSCGQTPQARNESGETTHGRLADSCHHRAQKPQSRRKCNCRPEVCLATTPAHIGYNRCRLLQEGPNSMRSPCAGQDPGRILRDRQPRDILMRGLAPVVGLLALVSSCGFSLYPEDGTLPGTSPGWGTPVPGGPSGSGTPATVTVDPGTTLGTIRCRLHRVQQRKDAHHEWLAHQQQHESDCALQASWFSELRLGANDVERCTWVGTGTATLAAKRPANSTQRSRPAESTTSATFWPQREARPSMASIFRWTTCPPPQQRRPMS